MEFTLGMVSPPLERVKQLADCSTWDGMGFFVGMVSPVDLLICGPVEQGTSGMGHQAIEGPSERHASFWEII